MPEKSHDICEELKRAAQAGDERAVAVLSAAGDDLSPERLMAEYLIAEGKRRLVDAKCDDDLPSGADGPHPDSSVRYDVEPIVDEEELARISREYGWEWLLANKPKGTVLPPASGRETVRTPNLNSANPSFAARLIIYVRDKFGGDAPQVYRAAHVSRKTYSAIVSNELRPVSKRTAIAFAFALRLSPEEADALLRSAGHALSEFLLEDIVYRACLEASRRSIAEASFADRLMALRVRGCRMAVWKIIKKRARDSYRAQRR